MGGSASKLKSLKGAGSSSTKILNTKTLKIGNKSFDNVPSSLSDASISRAAIQPGALDDDVVRWVQKDPNNILKLEQILKAKNLSRKQIDDIISNVSNRATRFGGPGFTGSAFDFVKRNGFELLFAATGLLFLLPMTSSKANDGDPTNDPFYAVCNGSTTCMTAFPIISSVVFWACCCICCCSCIMLVMSMSGTTKSNIE